VSSHVKNLALKLVDDFLAIFGRASLEDELNDCNRITGRTKHIAQNGDDKGKG
jgi:hypothetical protein